MYSAEAQCFNSLGPILSQPLDFVGSRDEITYIVRSGVISSPRHCSVSNSVTQFDSMLLVMLYTMESIQLLINTIQSIEREHFFTVIDHVHCQEWCNFFTKTLVSPTLSLSLIPCNQSCCTLWSHSNSWSILSDKLSMSTSSL